MASPSGPGQPSGPDPGSVLCDKCKKCVLEPSQNTENASWDRVSQVMKDYYLGPRSWPMGYIMASPYSPFRVEKELPKRDWRDAFEDLLALESGGEMISRESREQEKAVTVDLAWERARHCIKYVNKLNARDTSGYNVFQTAPNLAKSPGSQAQPSLVALINQQMELSRYMMQCRVEVAESFKAQAENSRALSASQCKDRGQWMASLITSGALSGWSSTLEDSEDGHLIRLRTEAEDQHGIDFTERELYQHFDEGRPLMPGLPGPPWHEVSYEPLAVADDDYQPELEDSPPLPEQEQRVLMSRTPDRPCFSHQTSAVERILLPNGNIATKVLMRTYLTNGDVEEKVLVQEPCKVLQEVDKAWNCISDRRFGFDKPI